ncbi:hypothetical protein TSUD_132120 [Trifolium subterraneum]|uniref:Retrotransposon Copia-like N-terminal domain-containing protein n=1 Tax=Trifolium subterraneum TaxID=3900 RepID=A0A2Z6LGS7_TRISU|nr:hypothetical protein TSUD_132120 [Trifolium subterraneum]
MSTSHTINIGATNTTTVIVLNTQSAIKLTGANFPAWKVQFMALLVGRQDQLILHAILSSVAAEVVTMLGNVKNSKDAWDVLNTMFASKTRSRIMHLKERLTRTTKGSKSVSEYLQGIKSISDELAVINTPLDDVDLVIHALNGLGSEFKEVSAALRTRENPIGFAELHDMLVDYENFLQRDSEPTLISTAHVAYRGKTGPHKKSYTYHRGTSSSNHRSTSPGHNKKTICQFCDIPGHSAKVCYKLHGYPSKRHSRPSAHSAIQTPHAVDTYWILDSGATHHITNNLDDLHLTTPYHGMDKITIGDGTGLPITHTGLEDKGASSKRIA